MLTADTIVGILLTPNAPDVLPVSVLVVSKVPVIVFTTLIVDSETLSFIIPVAPELAQGHQTSCRISRSRITL